MSRSLMNLRDLESLIRGTTSMQLFDAFDSLLDGTLASAETYPPSNIVQLDDDSWVIQLALAGLSRNDVKLTHQGTRLTVESVTEHVEDQPKDAEGTPLKFPRFIRKGIATRSFKLAFDLPKRATIESAEFSDGLLTINVNREPDPSAQPRVIEVVAGKTPSLTGLKAARQLASSGSRGSGC